MNAEDEQAMHALAVQLEHLTRGTGWKRAKRGAEDDPGREMWALINDATPAEVMEAMRRLFMPTRPQ